MLYLFFVEASSSSLFVVHEHVDFEIIIWSRLKVLQYVVVLFGLFSLNHISLSLYVPLVALKRFMLQMNFHSRIYLSTLWTVPFNVYYFNIVPLRSLLVFPFSTYCTIIQIDLIAYHSTATVWQWNIRLWTKTEWVIISWVINT